MISGRWPRRLRQLERDGVITGYRAVVDPPRRCRVRGLWALVVGLTIGYSALTANANGRSVVAQVLHDASPDVGHDGSGAHRGVISR